jgi:flagellar hook protein FlgE
MSLFGALDTAISGLTAQSASFGNISDDIANSQTTGFKRVDTSFLDYLTTSTPQVNEPGAVVAVPQYINTVQGTVTQSDNPLALAISGQGFFAVSQATGQTTSGAPVFSTQGYYTRDGNFQLNDSGYLVNESGDYLNGWVANANGTINTSSLQPIQVNQTVFAPISTSTVTLAANLPPAGATNGTTATQVPITSTVTVYDAQGNSHQLTLGFTATAANSNNWSVAVTDDLGATIATGTLAFNPSGTLASVTQGGVTNNTANSPAQLMLATTYPTAAGTQNITLNLGAIGGTSGLTQFAGSTYSLEGLSQNGVPPGQFNAITMQTNGSVVANYNNGQSRVIAQVPVVTFAAPDSLQSQNGANFTATTASGPALAQAAANNGAGALVTNSIEQSNVDIATEFSRMIVAQQAYSGNAQAVTTANRMLQSTLDMMH